MKGASSKTGTGRKRQQKRRGNWTDSKNGEVLQDLLTGDFPPASLLAALRKTAFAERFFVSEKMPEREKWNGKCGLMPEK